MCDVRAVAAPDVGTIDALAHLALSARQLGHELRLRGASSELRELIALAGLRGVLRVEPRRKAEEREQRVGPEEERELGDASA